MLREVAKMWAHPAVAAYILMEDEIDMHRTWWVHPMNHARKRFGEYHHLMPELRNDETRFVAYLRMKPASFDALHEKVQDLIQRR